MAATAQSIVRVSVSDEYTRLDSSVGGRRLYGIFIGKLYNYLFRLQSYTFSDVEGVPIRRFLEGVTETSCTPNALSVKAVRTHSGARREGKVLPHYVTTVRPDDGSSTPLLNNAARVIEHADRTGLVTYVTVEYLDGTAATVSTDTRTPDLQAVHVVDAQLRNVSVGRRDASDLTDRELCETYVRFGESRHSYVKNVRPYGRETVFKVREEADQHDLGCFLNTRMPKMPRSTCPTSMPFLPPVSSKVHICNLLREGFVFEVSTNGGVSMVKAEADRNGAFVLRTFDTAETLSSNHGDVSRPRYLRWNEPAVAPTGAVVGVHEVLNARGPLVTDLADSYAQRDNECHTQKWRMCLRERERYLNGHEIEYDERRFTFSREALGGGEVLVRDLFDRTTCIPAERSLRRGTCRVYVEDGRLKLVDPAYDGLPYFIRIGTSAAADGADDGGVEFDECHCNLRFHADEAVCAYVRAHDAPYDPNVPRLPTYQPAPMSSRLVDAAATERVLDGTAGASAPSSSDDTASTVFGLRHESDALQTLQRHLDRTSPFVYVVVANPNYTFHRVEQDESRRATVDGLVYRGPSVDAVIRARLGKIDATEITKTWTCSGVVEAKSHVSARPLERIDGTYGQQVERQRHVFEPLGVTSVYFVSWSFKCSHIFERHGTEGWRGPVASRSVMATAKGGSRASSAAGATLFGPDVRLARVAGSTRVVRITDRADGFVALEPVVQSVDSAGDVGITSAEEVRVADDHLYVHDGEVVVAARLFDDKSFVNIHVDAAIVQHMRLLGDFVPNRTRSSTETEAWQRTVSRDPRGGADRYNWMDWWVELQWLMALRPHAPASTLVSIDPAVMSTECAHSAVESTVMVGEMIKGASASLRRTRDDPILRVFRGVRRPTFEDAHIEERIRKELRRRTA